MTGCDFAQGRNARLVLAFNFWGVPLTQHASTISGCKNELKAVGNLLETVFNSDSGHGESEIEVFEHFRAAGSLGLEAETLGMNNGFEVKQSLFKHFIDYNEVK
jgi:hypothetical protein